eukprot:1188877-Prorocentrum_minimum.AAC.3
MTSFYGSSCANNGKDALNTPDRRRCEYKKERYTNKQTNKQTILRGPLMWDMSEVYEALHRIYPTSYHLKLKGALTSFYGSSCANNGKGALNTPEHT